MEKKELNFMVIVTDNRKNCTRYEKRSPDSSNNHSGDQEEKTHRICGV